MRTIVIALAAAASQVVASRPLASQSIARRVDAVREGTVLMRFAARPGVCGDGNGSIWTRQQSNTSWDMRRACVSGPVRLAIGRSENTTVSVRVAIGGERRAGASEVDLGTVSAPEAARYLLETAHSIGGRSATDAVSGAALADSVEIAPQLTSLVRDTNAPLNARRQALYWLGETSLPTQALAQVYDASAPFALREHFVYVVSQRRDDVAVDKLIDIAQHDADREIRKRAMYWLGQTEHPKAVKFLHDLITR